MRVLVACEYSGTVRDAFAAKGHDAWSCDLLATEKPGNHLQQDVFEAIGLRGWDIIILHPPCTRIALCGNSTYGRGMPKHSDRLKQIEWTADLWATAKMAARIGAVMENPKNVMAARIGKRTQAIHPWQFGHPEQKETWLWIHNLLPLTPTKIVYDEMMQLPRKQRERLHFMSPSVNRGHERSRFFPGIAAAMADQWG